MLTPQQLDAAYAAFAAFIGDMRLTPQALAIIQQAFLCGYAAGHAAATAPPPLPVIRSPGCAAGHLLPDQPGHLPVAAQLTHVALR